MFRKLSGIISKKPFVINDHCSSPPKKNFLLLFFLIAVVILVIIGFNFINPDWNDFFYWFCYVRRTD